MAEIWIKEAERLGDGSIGGAMDSPSAPPRAVWHTTESGAGDAAFNAVASYLIRVQSEPHILYDPMTDRLGQYGPLNASARALRNDGSTRTNRTGRVCIQIEVLAKAGKPFTAYWRPGPNFRALMRALRSWGIPDAWPAGALASSYSDDVSRSRITWATKGGHYGHCHVPGNDHWDPGAIDVRALLTAGGDNSIPSTGGETKATPEPSVSRATTTIGGLVYGYGAHGDHVTAVGRALVEKGHGAAYRVGPGPTWSDADTVNYAGWQRSLGFTGSDADGVPGETSLRHLMGTLPGAQPVVDLSNLISAARRDPGLRQGGTTHPTDVAVVEAALRAEGLLSSRYAADGSFGSLTKTAYAAWQRRCGYSGSGADGIPGRASLERLGATHGFTVKA
ncbi:peptidoglycan-binding protein [Streptomyces sp. C10-9-1]|uniref:peptidoglycan-binding protein n=1 Tax=Streptomyces sp. C10-9-1 TaxID=1859285 RepID=UPI0021126455|nr:peptidoglycan-binding protein [Streptomyces sp. C10-9-1]MCQ6554786.1 peptidoglycan-binding protein [Streptomyces sp. C10-9-1]